MIFILECLYLCLNVVHTPLLPLTVNNAGIGLIGPIECQSIDEMRTVMDTNFFGLVRLLKEILPDMKRRRKGHIVVISSVMGIQGKDISTSLNCHKKKVDQTQTVSLLRSAFLFQVFCSMTSMQRPSLPWRAFVRA